MRKGLRLTNKQFDEVDDLRNTTASADVFRNCSIILLSYGGHTIQGIAQMLGCSPETVKRIRRLWRTQGLAGLKPIKPTGRPSKATASFRELLAEAARTPPQTLGYGFATWSAARLAAHVAKLTGIRFSSNRVRHLLHEEGFSVQRPKHTMKGKRDEVAFQKAKKRLRGLKKKALAKDAPTALVFQDEVEIHRHPTLTRIWAPVGNQPAIPAPGKNAKRVVYGGVDFATAQTTYTVADTKSGAHVLVFLTTLLIAYAGRKILLVCDNGRFHHTKAVQEWLAAHRDQLEVCWLPPYCPSLHLIERLWGHLKRTVLAKVLYETLADLAKAFAKGLERINGKREQMGFMFTHDELQPRKAG